MSGLRVVQLTAENFKRLRAVDITPDPDAGAVVIAGRNAQGKTSVLDAIWAAIGGGAGAKHLPQPIRDGETSATVRVDLGEYVVTRKWTEKGSTLRVENAQGATYRSPQSILDGFVGSLSFDPLAFVRLPAKEQLSTLLAMVDLPFDPKEIEEQRRGVFEGRTDIGREVRRLEGALASMPPADDVQPVSVSALLDELDTARAVIEGNRAAWRRLNDAHAARRDVEGRIADLEDALAQARGQLADLTRQADEADRAVEALPDAPDIDAIHARLNSAEDVNARAAEQSRRREVEGELAAVRRQYEERTEELAAIDRRKADGLAAARFPVDGLGFDDGGVTFNRIPFAQASAAEQLRVSMAIAMAMAPHLRVIRVSDASLLDADSLALVQDMAAGQGFQMWLEVVADSADGTGFYIEDGAVAAAVER